VTSQVEFGLYLVTRNLQQSLATNFKITKATTQANVKKPSHFQHAEKSK